jgi:hypothetical protein
VSGTLPNVRERLQSTADELARFQERVISNAQEAERQLTSDYTYTAPPATAADLVARSAGVYGVLATLARILQQQNQVLADRDKQIEDVCQWADDAAMELGLLDRRITALTPAVQAGDSYDLPPIGPDGLAATVASPVPPSAPRVDDDRAEVFLVRCGPYWHTTTDREEAERVQLALSGAAAGVDFRRCVEVRETECVADARSYEGQLEDQRREITDEEIGALRSWTEFKRKSYEAKKHLDVPHTDYWHQYLHELGLFESLVAKLTA